MDGAWRGRYQNDNARNFDYLFFNISTFEPVGAFEIDGMYYRGASDSAIVEAITGKDQ